MDIDLNDLVVFLEVVEAGNFTAAGKKLNLPASAVSRRVARLEERLGYTLLHRTTRRVGLTDAGRVYYERTARITKDVEDASRAINEMASQPAGLVRVTAPPDDGGVIWRMLSGFVKDHPDVDLEVIHTLTYLDLIEKGIDIALRGGSPPDSTVFTAHKLITSRMLFVASPAYLEARGTPETLADLQDHDCIAMDNWTPNALGTVPGPDGPVRLKPRNRVRVNRLDTIRNAAVDGFGIAPLIGTTCWREIKAGELVEVLPGTFPEPADFFAVYPTGRRVSAAARALIEHLIEAGPQVAPPV